jgi:hypothetical protein
MTGQRRAEAMTEEPESNSDGQHSAMYEIRVQGHLGPEWADWFEGMTITLETNGNTVLTGPVADQAALHGLLKRVRDVGLPLISVTPLEHGRSTAPGTAQADQLKDE